MLIRLNNVGKHFSNHWLFQHLYYQFETGKRYVILGANGSGKSTLLQIIAGFRLPSQGSIDFFDGNKPIPAEKHYRNISIAAPYLELIEEFTLDELISFHFGFKTLQEGISLQDLPQLATLENQRSKPIRYYSSGMKQRVRLALAFYSNTPILLLDEPTSNLDKQGIAWYHGLLAKSTNRVVIICSNHKPEEYEHADEFIQLGNHLKSK